MLDFEWHFEQLDYLFPGEDNRQLFLRNLNPALQGKVLLDTSLKFEDLEGTPLVFPSGNMPWNRLLGMHAHFALENARKQGWLPEDQFTAAESKAMQLLEFSIDEDAAARIQRWIEST